MASVIVTPTAQRNLASIIATHSLPETTLDRFRDSLAPLRQFPRMGPPVSARTGDLRFTLGPWRWMIVLYRYDQESDQVRIISVQDGRSARSPRTGYPSR